MTRDVLTGQLAMRGTWNAAALIAIWGAAIFLWRQFGTDAQTRLRFGAGRARLREAQPWHPGASGDSPDGRFTSCRFATPVAVSSCERSAIRTITGAG